MVSLSGPQLRQVEVETQEYTEAFSAVPYVISSYITEAARESGMFLGAEAQRPMSSARRQREIVAMGNPLHFSADVPQRCLQLIDELWPHVEKSRQAGRADLGPLTTTFLISMSMPIIILPIERIERHKNSKSEAYADDRCIDPTVAKAVLDSLGGQRLSDAPFYLPGVWSFAKYPHFNVAKSIPDDLAAELGSDEAAVRANKMPVSQWCSILRNAMSHGGIAYLNESGRTSYGEPVKMYAFVSGQFDESKNLLHVNVLRISETNYRKFLSRWVGWLKSSGLASQLTAA